MKTAISSPIAVKIPIPENCATINVLISGGLDSTLLLYLIMRDSPQVPVICHTAATFRGTAIYTPPILEYMNSKFGSALTMKVWGKKQKILIRNLVTLVQDGSDEYVFSGCNANPPIDDAYFYPVKSIFPSRGDPANEKHLRPFINMDKRDIIGGYIQNDILDLMSLTRSCGRGSAAYAEYLTERCGFCFFCVERQWGITHHNIDDPDRTLINRLELK